MISPSKIFEVFEEDNRGRKTLYTINFAPGTKVYDELLVVQHNIEYRSWNHRKSKLAAAILKGCPNTGIRKGSSVLYLGAASGTTASHVSDMVGATGCVLALDSAPRVVRELVFVAETRKNMAPLLADANHPETYKEYLPEKVDIVYQDIAQRNQSEIFLKNCAAFLKKDGYALIAVKARSVDVAENPKEIFRRVRQEIAKELVIIDERTLDPFEKDHMFFVCKKKN